MKKLLLFSMIFSIVLLSSACLAEVKIEEFEKAEGVIYKYDDMSEVLTVSPDEEILDLMVDGKGIIQPVIISNEIGDKQMYLLILYLVALSDDSISPESAIIKTDKNRYLIDPPTNSLDSSYKNGKYIEGMYFACGETALQMVENMLSSTNVKIRIDGKSDVDFELGDVQRRALNNVYTAYKNAGCIEQDLSTYDILTPITVK